MILQRRCSSAAAALQGSGAAGELQRRCRGAAAALQLSHLCPFLPSGVKDASPYDVLVICLYVYKRTRHTHA